MDIWLHENVIDIDSMSSSIASVQDQSIIIEIQKNVLS